MSRIKLALIIIAICVVGACGSSKSDSEADSKSSASPDPEFSYADWSQAWSGEKQTYLNALQGFNNQLNMLNKGSATDQQYAMVIKSNSRSISEAAGAFATGLGDAGQIPEERADLQTAADNLRAALVNEEKAYGVPAGCPNLKCMLDARPGVDAAAKQSAAALAAMPSE